MPNVSVPSMLFAVMKNRILAVVLAVIGLGLGIALILVRNKAVDQQARDTASILGPSNQLVTTTGKFDTLVRKYSVSRMRSGSVFASDTLKQESEVKDWLTTFTAVDLEPTTPLEPNAEYYVNVVLTIHPKKSVPSLWSLVPWGRDECYGRYPFTYIK